jgi:hypothetical protein
MSGRPTRKHEAEAQAGSPFISLEVICQKSGHGITIFDFGGLRGLRVGQV